MTGRRAMRLVSRAMRVTSYALFLTLALGAFGARKVHAEVKDGASALGEQLLQLAPSPGDSAFGGEGQHDLELNGQRVHVSAAVTELPLGAVLDRFQRSCETHADGMATDLADLDDSLARPPRAEGHPGIGVIRDDRAARGVVACFATGEETDVSSLAQRLERFAQSRDLGDLGRLRYVAARRTEGGATQVVATWTDAHLRLGDMFPAQGDASGRDPREAPRPEGSRRLLSAAETRAPHGVFVYELGGRVENERALADYATLAARAGWSADPAVSAASADTRAFERGGIDVLVTATAQADGPTLLSIVEMAPSSVSRETRR